MVSLGLVEDIMVWCVAFGGQFVPSPGQGGKRGEILGKKDSAVREGGIERENLQNKCWRWKIGMSFGFLILF